MIRKITNEARDYAWGSYNLISDFFGVPATGKPMAEIWFGTHDGSPTEVVGESKSLLAFRGKPLSFLLKILAAGQPLSIQAHPTVQQAIEGFARENAAGIPVDSPIRNYRDENHKPEMVVALTDFRALTGFREATETAVLLAKLQSLANEELANYLQAYRDLLADSIEALFTHLIESRGSLDAVTEELTKLCERAQFEVPEFAGSLQLVVELEELYPGDPGVIISLLMNYVELMPNQALQLGAGNIHAYLSGLVLEIMASSDNVLRGGLTPKHIDAEELKRVLNFDGGAIPVLEASRLANGIYQYPKLVPDYGFYRLEVSGGNLLADINLPSDSIAICVSGEVTIFDSQGETQLLKRAEAAYLADARLFSVSGNGVMFLATN